MNMLHSSLVKDLTSSPFGFTSHMMVLYCIADKRSGKKDRGGRGCYAFTG